MLDNTTTKRYSARDGVLVTYSTRSWAATNHNASSIFFEIIIAEFTTG